MRRSEFRWTPGGLVQISCDVAQFLDEGGDDEGVRRDLYTMSGRAK